MATTKRHGHFKCALNSEVWWNKLEGELFMTNMKERVLRRFPVGWGSGTPKVLLLAELTLEKRRELVTTALRG